MEWTKSSRCSADQPSCVEVTSPAANPDVVLIRDSKHPDRPSLHFTRAEWTAFLAGAQAGDFDRI